MSNLHSTPQPTQQTVDDLRLQLQQMTQAQQANALVAKPTDQSITQQSQNVSQLQAEKTLVQARDTHHLVIDWVRSLDAKINPLLAANSALIAGSLAVLSQQGTLLASHYLTSLLLGVALIPLLFSLVMSISTVSPSLKWARLGKHRHLPDASLNIPTSIIFFGQISRFNSAKAYAEMAKTVLSDQDALLTDILTQTYINAQIAANKSQHIALSARGLFVSIVLLVLAGLALLLKS